MVEITKRPFNDSSSLITTIFFIEYRFFRTGIQMLINGKTLEQRSNLVAPITPGHLLIKKFQLKGNLKSAADRLLDLSSAKNLDYSASR